MITKCTRTCIETTLTHLRDAGTRYNECVVLWLGKNAGDCITVTQCYRPMQRAKADQFYIPPEGMTTLQAKLRSERLMVAAQVHSHPAQAFHSKADDDWAIVRHEGALSLVIPRFAIDTYADNFLDQVKIYRFSENASWNEVPPQQVTKICLQII